MACPQVVHNHGVHETARTLPAAGSEARATLEVQWFLRRGSKGCLHVARVASVSVLATELHVRAVFGKQ